MDTISFGSLFTGIGGLDLGFERAGMVCAYQVEIDDFCQKVLAKHWPNVPRFKDVKNVGKQNLPTTDVICGGFPCQPHSLAGQRRGADDDRNLWPEYLRIVDELRPGVVVGENVPGIITSMLDKVLFDLEGIGYTAQTFIVPACAFGAPHRRDRIWIVAYSNGAEWRTISQRNEPHRNDAGRQEAPSGFRVCNQNDGIGPLANTRGARLERGEWSGTFQRREAVTHGATSERNRNTGWEQNWLEVATRLCRVDDGIPDRVDRLKSLGNAVVPQVAEWIGNRVVELYKRQSQL